MSSHKSGDENGGVWGFESDSEMEEVEVEVEVEVNQMAHRILLYRSTFSAHLKSSFLSLLDEASRPVAIGAFAPGISVRPDHEDDEQTLGSEGAISHDEALETANKIQLLEDKISSNITMIPTVLKRMKDCISTIDNLDSYNGLIHPAFKRKKTT